MSDASYFARSASYFSRIDCLRTSLEESSGNRLGYWFIISSATAKSARTCAMSLSLITPLGALSQATSTVAAMASAMSDMAVLDIAIGGR